MRLPALKFLRTFQVAANRLSFRLAAEELFVTPSAVSHQIKALEEQLGVVLFERGPRSLTLTGSRTQLSSACRDDLCAAGASNGAVADRHGRSVVRLRTPPFFATELLLPRLLSFLEAQPDTDIHIDTAATPPALHAPMQICRSCRCDAGTWSYLSQAVLADVCACVLADVAAACADRHGQRSEPPHADHS
jgi:LysR family glycine cleavage system transcriptional activator